MNEIKKRNERKEFVNKFATQNGYPVWNKVLMGTSQKQYAHASLAGNSLDGVTDTTILIPFVMEGEFSVKGFICATLNDSVSLSYSLAKDYKAYEEKLDNSKTASSAFAMLSMALNKIVFNEEYYKITNPKILSTDTAHIATQKIKLNEINFSITDSANMRYLILCSSFTQTQAVCGTPGAAVCSDEDGCDAGSCPTNSCHLVTTTTNICTGIDYPDILGSTGGGSTGEGSGSNGGGPIPYVYPCETTQNNPAPFTATNNIEDPGDCPEPTEGDGWIPWDDNTDFDFFLATLTPAQNEFWGNTANAQFVQIFSSYLTEHSFSTEAKDFIRWAIDFLINNPSTTIEEFQNWFMNPAIDNTIVLEALKYLAETNYTFLTYTVDNYPGKDDLMPYEWWQDENWIRDNITIDDLNPDEQPNATEIMLFCIFRAEAVFHIKNSTNALNTAQQLVTNGTFTRIHNGKGDAFRHTFWNALDASDFGKSITLLFTSAHEVGSTNNSLEILMDLHNNTAGAHLGQNYSITTSSSVIQASVISAMQNTSNISYLFPLADHDGNNILSNTVTKSTNQ
ncbi:MAG: hypothetical protein IPG30_10100 [Chitinophagaceae bacterium]|nr:hypothetical protein [Chitinophagaceae bacterium]